MVRNETVTLKRYTPSVCDRYGNVEIATGFSKFSTAVDILNLPFKTTGGTRTI